MKGVLKNHLAWVVFVTHINVDHFAGTSKMVFLLLICCRAKICKLFLRKFNMTMKIFQLLGIFLIIIILSTCETGGDAPTTTIGQETIDVKPTDTIEDNGIKEVIYDPDRNHWQRPNLIISLLGKGDLSEMTVVDIGAGAGFFTFKIAPLAKKVIALDIDQNFLDIIDTKKLTELPPAIQGRVQTRLTPRDSPKLDANEVDAVLIVNTFMFIESKLNYLNKLKEKIKPGGRLVIVDFKRKRTGQGPRPRKHRTPLYIAEDLLYKAGYKNIQARDTDLSEQYILVAER